MKKIRTGVALSAAILLPAFSPSTQAIPITVDVSLSNTGIAASAATVDMSIAGNILTITLRNVLAAGGPSSSEGLLTGVAFDMPNSFDIIGGSVVTAPGSVIVGGLLNGLPGVVSGEWGYRNGRSGHFNDAGLTTDTQVSAMEADGTFKFSVLPVYAPDVLDGPEFGLVSAGGDPGGLTAIRDAVTIALTLNGVPNGGFLNSIEEGTVAVTWGSPSPGSSRVPDAGSSMALLGIALLGIEGVRRQLKR